eukprot:3545274-Alexandrium_andersonii.AAC.1
MSYSASAACAVIQLAARRRSVSESIAPIRGAQRARSTWGAQVQGRSAGAQRAQRPSPRIGI